eukprot:COSAG04_NODE_5656_length_1537_cov_6.184284_1_plen_177_part_10
MPKKKKKAPGTGKKGKPRKPKKKEDFVRMYNLDAAQWYIQEHAGSRILGVPGDARPMHLRVLVTEVRMVDGCSFFDPCRLDLAYLDWTDGEGAMHTKIGAYPTALKRWEGLPAWEQDLYPRNGGAIALGGLIARCLRGGRRSARPGDEVETVDCRRVPDVALRNVEWVPLDQYRLAR